MISLKGKVATLLFVVFTRLYAYDWDLPAVSDEVLRNSNVLIISIAGAARTLKAAPWPVGTNDDVQAMDELDYIGDIAYSFESFGKNKIVSLSRDPRFDVSMGLNSGVYPFDDDYFWPSAVDLAGEIRNIANKMLPEKKLILIGKSMGGCKLRKAANELFVLSPNVVVDLLILVDASCENERHDNTHINIAPNVKKVISFYQRKAGESQNGYLVSTYFQERVQTIKCTPEKGCFAYWEEYFDLDRTNYDVNGCGLCQNVGHNTIDTCTGLVARVKGITNNEIGRNIISIVNSFLND